jgi:hypothetical protein
MDDTVFESGQNRETSLRPTLVDGTLTVPVTRRNLFVKGGKLAAMAAMLSAAGV